MRSLLMRLGERLSPLQRCHLRVSLAVEDPPASGILRDYGMLRARGTPWARGTSPCAPGAFSLTAMIFRSPRASKGAWCARRGAGMGGQGLARAGRGGRARERGETKRRKPRWTKAGKGRGTGRKGEGAKKRSRCEKASKKCPNMAKRAQIASLAISRGGGQKDYICNGRDIWSREA